MQAEALSARLDAAETAGGEGEAEDASESFGALTARVAVVEENGKSTDERVGQLATRVDAVAGALEGSHALEGQVK
jgi:hypothetical protein